MEEKLLAVLKLLARIILENGGETHRVEDTITRIGHKFDLEEIEAIVLPVGFFITISSEEVKNQTIVQRVKKRTIDLSKMNAANKISRLIVEEKIDLDEALNKLGALANQPSAGKYYLLLGAGLASGFFTLLFQGNIPDFFISFFCGAIIQTSAFYLADNDLFPLVISLLGGFLLTMIATTSSFFIDGLNLEAIISGAIMPLLPGLAMTNAIRDTMQGHLISGLVRATEALIIALGLAAGAGFGLKLWLFLGGAF